MAKQKEEQAVSVRRTLLNPSYKPAALDAKLGLPGQLRSRRPVWKRSLVSLLLALLTFGILTGTWDAVNISRASSQILGSGNLFGLIAQHGAISQNGRTNILLVGYSIDDPGHPGASLTDSILLLSLSTKTRSGYMLSIPRDLYVNIPGFGYGKI